MKVIALTIIFLFYFEFSLNAQTEEEKMKNAQKLTEKAKEYFDKGDYDKAIQNLLEAYKEYPFSEILFNIGMSYETKKDYENALKYYRDYFDTKPNEDLKKITEERILEIERLKDKEVDLFIEVNAFDAEIYIDGEKIGTTPLPLLKIKPGKKVIEIKHPKYKEWKSDFVVQWGKKNNLEVVLEKKVVEIKKEKEVPQVEVPVVKKEVKEKPEEEVTLIKEEVKPAKKRLWTWVSLGVGVASIGTGVIFHLRGKSLYDDLKSDTSDENKIVENKITQSSLNERKREINSKYNLAWTFYGLGATGIVGGVVLYFIEGKEKITPISTFNKNEFLFSLTMGF